MLCSCGTDNCNDSRCSCKSCQSKFEKHFWGEYSWLLERQWDNQSDNKIQNRALNPSIGTLEAILDELCHRKGLLWICSIQSKKSYLYNKNCDAKSAVIQYKVEYVRFGKESYLIL